ncbi:hypothetical protein H4S14_000090 [Agrobacterium vitis]|nr:hypothetical protein [Agrobacterium vitis]MBE1436363.1 hypothetical protein [Agrobacterium vitis]
MALNLSLMMKEKWSEKDQEVASHLFSPSGRRSRQGDEGVAAYLNSEVIDRNNSRL